MEEFRFILCSAACLLVAGVIEAADPPPTSASGETPSAASQPATAPAWWPDAGLGPLKPVQHPNLLLNREEIVRVKAKIAQYPWAANLFEKVKATANGENTANYQIREQALCYVLTDERAYADKVRACLLGRARGDVHSFENPPQDMNPNLGFNIWQDQWDSYAWAYDLTYDTFSAEERQLVERWLREACKVMIRDMRRNWSTPNLMFVIHFNVGIVGYCLGDPELIDYALNDPGNPASPHGAQSGGFYPVMDSMIVDKLFWNEAPGYGLTVDLWGTLALAEAAMHYDGTDLYHYVSKKNGGSLKGFIDGYLRMGYPLERTGIRNGQLRMATFGDGSTAYGPNGTMRDTYLTDDFFLGALEIGYKRYRDPGYAWVLSLNPARDTDLGSRAGRQTMRASIWGYLALTHGEPLPVDPVPPPGTSGVYPDQGFAMLRADESPAFWTGGTLAALLKLGNHISHGHADYYELLLHGKGRLLYPGIQVIGYEPTYLGWTSCGISHSTLLVDGQSPSPGPYTTLQDFTPEVKFAAISGSAFDGVTQTRRLLMTKEYLADIFHAADLQGSQRCFDWVLHGLGRLYPGNPGEYRPTQALLPNYWWVDNERGRSVDGTWEVDWIQRSAGIDPALQFGRQWFDREVGVRMTMLGAAGTGVYYGDGPITNGPPFGRIDGNPEGAVPMTVVRRQSPATTYAAVHEPYEGQPRIQEVRRLAETQDAVALAITTPDYIDYVMTAFDDQPHTLTTPNGEAFTFTDYAYLRMAKDGIIARGKLTAFRLSFPLPMPGGATTVTLNGGQRQALDRVRAYVPSLSKGGEFVQLGDHLFRALPTTAALTTSKNEVLSPSKDDPAERAASLHYYWLPEEVHLSAVKAGDRREVEMHLRAVGPGEVTGALQVSAREGVSVTPSRIEIAPLREGQERIVRLTVRTADKAGQGLYPITFVPEGMPAARQTLTASVGVVMTQDRRIPQMMQDVIRSPGYTMKVDVRSGVSYYLLDADGHRRFGAVDRYGGGGFPSVETTRYGGYPCDFVWPGNNSLTVGCADMGGGNSPRLRYTFYEDRIVFGLVLPTDPRRTYTMSLGAFDAMNPPVHKGKPAAGGHQFATYVADWFFFPHPTFRQGVLIIPPPQTALSWWGNTVSLPLKAGQELTLKFATQEEVDQLK